MHPSVIHPTQRAGSAADQRPHTLGGAFGYLGCGVNRSIHHREHTALAGLGTACHLHGLKQIERTIRTQSRGRSHRSHQHHGPRVVDQLLQQPGRFLQRVGAMGDHHSSQGRITCERQTNALHKLAPMLKEQIRAVDIGHLLNVDFGQLLHRRHGIQQFRPCQSSCGVGVEAGAVSTTSGDGSTSGKQQNPSHGSRRRNASTNLCI